ncbi:unnamed protein product [Heterobilharzia americana]|nr:unnamed protein product [Heterobilharzia americana]
MLCRTKQKRKRITRSSDKSGICILMILYILQGIPIGLSASIPFMLQSSYYTGSYQAQATFSLVFWPFSFKLAWAPIIDSIYSTHIGRRKTWLIPTQYAIGIELIILANYINNWLGRDPDNPWSPLGTHHPVNILSLTIAFFGLTFLAATQDIAVDGWAISILSKKNLGWASTCNVVGQTVGYVTSFILFLCLESPNISNTYLRWTPIEGKGLITFSGFLYFWGITFMVTNTLLVLFKHEKDSKLDTEFLHKTHTLNHQNHNCTQSNNNNSDPTINTDTVQDYSVTSSPNSEAINEENDHHLNKNKPVQGNTDLELIDRTKQILRNNIHHNNSCKSQMIKYNEHFIENPRIDDNGNHNNDNIDNDNTNNAESCHHNSFHPTAEIIEKEADLSLIDTYRVMFGVIRLKPVWQFLILLTTVKVCLAAPETVFSLKLIEHGFPKERLALIGVLLLPIQAVLPLLVTRWTNGPRPLGVFIIAFLPKLLVSCLTVPIIHYSTYFRISPNNQTQINLINSNRSDLNNFTDTINSISYSLNIKKDMNYSFTWPFYAFLLCKLVIYSIISSIMMVVQVAFHAKISDPTVGGTYMTLLNTVSNIASSLPSTAFLSLIEPLTIRACILNTFKQTTVQVINSTNPFINHTNNEQLYNNSYSFFDKDELVQKYNATCKPPQGIKACEAINGTCVTQLDGFYLEVGLSVVFGLIVYPLLLYPLASRLDALPSSAYSFRLTGEGCCQRKVKQHRIPLDENVTECSQLSTA